MLEQCDHISFHNNAPTLQDLYIITLRHRDRKCKWIIVNIKRTALLIATLIYFGSIPFGDVLNF